jgi:hypothetical protein
LFCGYKLSKILKVSLDRDKKITYSVNMIDTLITYLSKKKEFLINSVNSGD